MAILAVVLGIRALVARGSEEVAASPATEPAATGSATAPASAPATAEATGSPDDPAACAAADLEVGLVLDPGAPSAGSAVDFEVSLINTAQLPCLLETGAEALVATVTSGEDEIWSSAHCAEEREERLLLDAGGQHTMTLRWPGTRSAPGCGENQPEVRAGTYRVAVEGGAETTSVVFSLS